MLFTDIVGNADSKTQLAVAAQSAAARNTSVPHLLFEGTAGCGKTSMASSLSEMLGVPFIQLNPVSIKSQEDILSVASQLPLEGYDRDGNIIGKICPAIIFLDEVHNLPLKGQELLGIVMETWKMSVNVKRGRYSSPKGVWFPRFTLIGATTLSGKLSKPFRDRFKASFKFEPYNIEDSVKILKTHSKLLGIDLDIAAAASIALRGRGVPRILVRYLERIRDFAVVLDMETITEAVVDASFVVMGIDKDGLTKSDVSLLLCLYESDGTPVGLETLSIVLNEAPSTINNEIEPFLIQMGFVIRTPRGRVLSNKGIEWAENTMKGQINNEVVARV